MSIYDDLQLVATDVLTEFQQGEIYYVELITASGPVDNPGVTTPTTHTVVGGVARGVEFKYIDNSQIVASDGQLTFPVNQTFTPKIHDFVLVGGQKHKIKMCTAVPPTGTPVVYVVVYER